MTRVVRIVMAAAVLAAVAGPTPAAQDGKSVAGLGDVHFATSCTTEAQRHFDRGLRYQHSFWYRESKAGFEAALEADPSCAIAFWGIAHSLMANPFNPTPPRNLVEGLAAIRTAQRLGANTPRERELIEAVAVFYGEADRLDQVTRTRAYAAAMATVAGHYPDDDEIQIYYALALDMSAPPADKTYANQLKAAAILEPILRRRPTHPGAAHYLVHTYDYPALAPRGVDAAERYARIAEAAPHAQHMPSHIFTRVGQWPASIAANQAAARLARANREPDDELHASDYLVYAYLQQGRDRDARQVLDAMAAVTGFNPERNTAPFALAASAARYAVERGDWTGAARLEARPSRFAYIEAISHFARALGAARSGALPGAHEEIDALAGLRDRLRASGDAYWAGQVAIQWQAALAWTQLAEGEPEMGLATMREAAEAEDRTEKNVVTPGPLAPARELYGEMLLARGRPLEALAAFEATIAREPNRFRSIAGAAAAAGEGGLPLKAKDYCQQLVTLAGGAEITRPEVTAAQRYLAGRQR